MLPPIQNRRRRSLLRRNAGPLYVKDGLVADWSKGFNSTFDTIQDKTSNDNDLTLYSGRYPNFNGIDGAAEFGALTLGALPAKVKAKVRPASGETTYRTEINGVALSAPVVDNGTWQDVDISIPAGGQTSIPSSFTIASDGTNRFDGDVSDVEILDAIDTPLLSAPLTESSATSMTGLPVFDRVTGAVGQYVGTVVGNTGEGIAPEFVGTVFEQNEDKMWFNGEDDQIALPVSLISALNGKPRIDFNCTILVAGVPLANEVIFFLPINETTLTGYVVTLTSSGIISVGGRSINTEGFQFFDSTETVVFGVNTINVYIDYANDEIGIKINDAGIETGSVNFSQSSYTAGSSPSNSASIAYLRPTTSSYFKGSIYDVNIDGVSAYSGTETATWTDTIGSNNGTANGNPATVGQKRATTIQTAGMDWNKNTTDYASTVLVPASLTTPSLDALGNPIAEPRVSDLQFNPFGEGEYAKAKDSDSLDVTTEATWELVFNPFGVVTVNESYLAKTESSSSSRSFHIFKDVITAADEIAVILSQVGSDINVGAFSGLIDSVQHIVVVYDGSKSTPLDRVRCYADGVDLGAARMLAGEFPASIRTNEKPLTIGARLNSGVLGNFSDRKIFARPLYTRALELPEIQQNYNSLRSKFNLPALP